MLYFIDSESNLPINLYQGIGIRASEFLCLLGSGFAGLGFVLKKSKTCNMEIKFKYGNTFARATIRSFDCLGELVPKRIATLQAPEKILQDALNKPIGTYPFSRLFHRGKSLMIVLSGYEGEHGAQVILPFLLDALNEADVPDDEVKVLVANGHQPILNGIALERVLGVEVMKRVPVFQHDSQDFKNLEYVGKTKRGIPVFLNRLLLEAEQIIIFGTIRHHFFTGYDGGPKVIVPGCAGQKTISRIYALAIDPTCLRLNPNCTDGNLVGNPLHQNLQESYRCFSASFGFYPIMNSHNCIISVFAGHPLQAHIAGCRMVDSVFRVPIREKADLTVVGCGGSPQDNTFLRAYRALHHATYATKEGGTIIFLAACPGGLGSKTFHQWFDDRDKSRLLAKIHTKFAIDATIAIATLEKTSRFKIIMVTELNEEILQKMGMIAAPSLQDAIELAKGGTDKSMKSYLMPDGFRTVPALKRAQEGYDH